MQVELEQKGRTLIVRLQGELDQHVADDLRQAVEKELSREIADKILLSLEGLTFMDSSGLGVILGRYRRLSEAGGKMAACCLNSQLTRIFELAGLNRLMPVYATEDEALAQL